jgi:hypothetical protein
MKSVNKRISLYQAKIKTKIKIKTKNNKNNRKYRPIFNNKNYISLLQN